MTGFTAVRDSSGKPYSGAATRYFVSASDGTALYIGDPVAILGTNTETGANYRTVTKATLTTNSKWCGVVQGFEPVSPETTTTPNLENKHRPASTAMYAWVIDDPDIEFIIGEDGAGAVLVTGDVGNLGLVVAGAGGSTAYGKSSVVLDSSTFASGSATTDQVLLIGKQDAPGNDLGTGTTSTAKWRVKINPLQHQLVTPAATV